MANIRTLGTGKNKRYQVRWRAPDGKESSETFARIADARDRKATVETELRHGDYVDPQSGRVKLSELFEQWRSNPSWQPSTRERNVSILDNDILPRWGATPLQQIRHEDIQAWVNEVSRRPRHPGSTDPISPHTVRKIFGAFRGIVQIGVRTRRLRYDPTEGIALPALTPRRRKYLTAAEVERLAASAGDQRDAILLLAYTGMRFGEFAALRVDDFDFERRRIEIDQSVTFGKDGAIWSLPKGKLVRSVPLPAFLIKPLASRIEGGEPSDLVFPARGGVPIRNRNFRRDSFNPAAKKAGLTGLTPHELRHTAASLAISAGATVLGVQRMLGHRRPSTTLDHYSDLFENDLDELGNALGAMRSRLNVDDSWMAPLDVS